jgi:hypothetical protein
MMNLQKEAIKSRLGHNILINTDVLLNLLQEKKSMCSKCLTEGNSKFKAITRGKGPSPTLIWECNCGNMQVLQTSEPWSLDIHCSSTYISILCGLLLCGFTFSKVTLIPY